MLEDPTRPTPQAPRGSSHAHRACLPEPTARRPLRAQEGQKRGPRWTPSLGTLAGMGADQKPTHITHTQYDRRQQGISDRKGSECQRNGGEAGMCVQGYDVRGPRAGKVSTSKNLEELRGLPSNALDEEGAGLAV